MSFNTFKGVTFNTVYHHSILSPKLSWNNLHKRKGKIVVELFSNGHKLITVLQRENFVIYQVGWIKMNNDFTGAPLNGTYYFFQYYDPSMTHAYTILNQYGPAVGSSHTYLTLLDETNTYYGTVDNATVASYPSGFTGIFTEYSGEIDNNNSAYFAGSSNNGLYMWNIYNAYMSGGTKVWVLSPQLDFNTINQNPYGVLYQGSWVVGNPNASFNYWDTRN